MSVSAATKLRTSIGRREPRPPVGSWDLVGSVRRVPQKPVQARGHGMLVMFDVTDLTKVARHDREGSYEGND